MFSLWSVLFCSKQKTAYELLISYGSSDVCSSALGVLGPGSGDRFALDIDVLDEALAWRAMELADDILGYTPFRRVGRAPKIALLFRSAPDDPAVNTSRKFVSRDDAGGAVNGTAGIYILTQGQLITAFG